MREATRLRRRVGVIGAVAVLAASFVGMTAAPASAAVSGSITLSSDASTYQAFAQQARFTVTYNLSGLTSGDDARVVVDFCDMFAYATGSPELISPATMTSIGCADGYGTPGAGKRVTSDPLTAAGGGSTGSFEVKARSADALAPGTHNWPVQARLVVNGITEMTASITVQVVAFADLSVSKRVVTIATANDPTSGTMPGYNVTYEVSPLNRSGPYGGVSSAYAAGTTTVVDPIPPGAEFVSTTRTGANLASLDDGSYPRLQTVGINSPYTITHSLTDVTVSIDDMISWPVPGGGGTRTYAAFEVTYWYPAGPAVDATNTVNMTWSGETDTATAPLYLGDTNTRLRKFHYCYDSQADTRTAHLPAFGDNSGCYATPHGQALITIDVAPFKPTTPTYYNPDGVLVNPFIYDRLDPVTKLTHYIGVLAFPEFGNAPPNFSQYSPSLADPNWEVAHSTDPACDQGSSYTVGLPVDLADVRCLRWHYAGIPTVKSWPTYQIGLRDPNAADVNDPGEYRFTTNTATIRQDNLGSVNGSPLDPDGTGSVQLTSTWWNVDGIVFAYKNTTTLSPVRQVGEHEQYRYIGPNEGGQAMSRQYAGDGWTNLVVRDELPPELRLDPPSCAAITADQLPLDDAGAPVPYTCTVGPGGTWFELVFGPAGTHLPRTRPGGADNDYVIRANTQVVAGLADQLVPNTALSWTAVSPAPNGSMPPNPASRPRESNVAYLRIGGVRNLTVTKAAAATSVEGGANLSHTVTVANVGTVGTSASYAYDLFGGPPAGCAAGATLASMPTQGSGAPAVLEYTTDPAPTVASSFTNWSASPPGSLGIVTGVRWQLASPVLPVAGYFGPGDTSSFTVVLVAPPATGSNLCNLAVVDADGLDPATDDTSTPIRARQGELRVHKFYDVDGDGIQDPGEPDIVGWTFVVTSGSGATVASLTTGPGGVASTVLAPNSYTVSETLPGGWHVTTGGVSQTTVVNEGATTTVNFGNNCDLRSTPGGHTIGYWRNNNGQALLNSADFVALTALHLRNANGTNRDFTASLSSNKSALSSWLQAANATNMAYMLSAQLTATVLSVRHGFTNGTALVAPGMTVNDLIAAAEAALTADGNTPSGDPNRPWQTYLKDLLDAVNNGGSFVVGINPTPCPR